VSVDPSGMLSEPLDNLATLIANCATWRTWVEADTVAEAKASIYPSPVDFDDMARPYACIWWDREFRKRAIAEYTSVAGPNSLELVIEADVPEAYRDDHTDAMYWFLNQLGAIIAEAEALVATGNYFLARGWHMERNAIRRSLHEESAGDGDYMRAVLRVEYGA